MKKENSQTFQLDWRNIRHISGSVFVGLLSIYATNTDFFNKILSENIDKQYFSIIVMILGYCIKKYLTNYSEEKNISLPVK